MSNNMTTYREAIAQAVHRKAIGATDVVLTDAEGIDWGQCYKASSSGGGLPADVLFTFTDQGLTLRWYLELRTRRDSIGGRYVRAVDVAAIARVLGALPSGCIARAEFICLLETTAAELEKRADEWMASASSSYGEAALLRKLAPPAPLDEVPF